MKPVHVLAAAIVALGAASVPASADGYYGRGGGYGGGGYGGGYGRGGGWSPGAAAAVGAIGGLAIGSAIVAGSRPAYGPPPAYYGPPPPAEYGGCYVVHRRVWVQGWGWDVRPQEVCD